MTVALRNYAAYLTMQTEHWSFWDKQVRKNNTITREKQKCFHFHKFNQRYLTFQMAFQRLEDEYSPSKWSRRGPADWVFDNHVKLATQGKI